MTETAEIPQDSAAPDFSMRAIIDMVAEAEQIREAAGVVASEQIGEETDTAAVADEPTADEIAEEADVVEEAADSVAEADKSTAEAKPASMRGLIDMVAEAEVMEDEDVDESITVYAQLYDGYSTHPKKYGPDSNSKFGYLHPRCTGDGGASVLDSLQETPVPWNLHEFAMFCAGKLGGVGTELDTNISRDNYEDGDYRVATTFDSDGTAGKMAEIRADVPRSLADEAREIMRNPLGESAAVTEEAAPAAELKTDPVILVHDAISNLKTARTMFGSLQDDGDYKGSWGAQAQTIKSGDAYLEATAGIFDRLVELQPEFAEATEQKDECVGLSVDMFNARKDLERLAGDRIADPSEPRQVIEDVIADMPDAIDAWRRKIESIRDSLGFTNTYDYDY